MSVSIGFECTYFFQNTVEDPIKAKQEEQERVKSSHRESKDQLEAQWGTLESPKNLPHSICKEMSGLDHFKCPNEATVPL